MIDLRYPIGTFAAQDLYTTEDINGLIHQIENLPARLEKEVKGLTDGQLDTPYREGGWTVRQLIHHISDSHMNAYIRLKWTLTEPTPTIKAYNEKDWAETPEAKLDPGISLMLLSALHTKWVALLKLLKPSDLQREFLHPESKKMVRLDRQIALYAWHGDHHLAHIARLKDRMGWK